MNKFNTNDLDFNFTAHPLSGDISIKSGLDSLKQSIKNILMTSILERPFNTNLNINIKSYLFENFNIYYEDILKQEIKRIILTNEPRILINEIVLNYQENDQNLLIYINFSGVNNLETRADLEFIVERIR